MTLSNLASSGNHVTKLVQFLALTFLTSMYDFEKDLNSLTY